MLKTKLVSLAIFTALTAASSIASASIITFDDVTVKKNDVVSNGYKGFQWENFYAIKKDYYPGTGYEYGTISGQYSSYNGSSYSASISSKTAFTLNDLFITKAWYEGKTRIEGYIGETLTYRQEIFSSTTAPTLAILNWTKLNRVTFSDAGGEQSVFDNIRVNEAVAPVPEPETYALMGMGLVGLLAARRRKMK